MILPVFVFVSDEVVVSHNPAQYMNTGEVLIENTGSCHLSCGGKSIKTEPKIPPFCSFM